MRLKTRQRITAGLLLAMVLLFLIPVLCDGKPVGVGVHIAWQMTEIILLLILSAIWHDYNKR